MMNRITRISLTLLLVGATMSGASAEPPDNDQSTMMKRMKEMADTDRDGRISKTEFMAMSEKRFAVIDANGDGYIDEDELAQAQTRIRQYMAPSKDK